LEEYTAGRSRVWYWNQVVIAILIGSYRDIRAHPLLAVRAMLTGWAVSWAFFNFLYFPLSNPGEWLFVRGIVDLREWLPGGQTAYFVVGSLGSAVCGWVIARFHRHSMLLLFVTLLTIWNCSYFPAAAADYFSSVHYGHDWFRHQFVSQALLALVVIPLSTLIGGAMVPCLSQRPSALEGEPA
jgi:hypothetical protein